jgi:hypothetical protein
MGRTMRPRFELSQERPRCAQLRHEGQRGWRGKGQRVIYGASTLRGRGCEREREKGVGVLAAQLSLCPLARYVRAQLRGSCTTIYIHTKSWKPTRTSRQPNRPRHLDLAVQRRCPLPHCRLAMQPSPQPQIVCA